MKNEVNRAFMAKKRFFILILVALVGAGMMWAKCPEGFTDYVDATQYLTDIKLNVETGELTFTDNFKTDQELLRDYDIVFFRPNGTCPFYYNSMYDRYRFGMYNEYFLFNASIAYYVNSSAGGKKTFNIEEQLDKVLSYGYAEAYMAFRPVFYTTDPDSKKLISTSYYSKEDPKDDKYLWLVNGCYVTIPTISNLSITLPDNAHFEQSMTVRVDLTSRNRCSCKLCYSEDGKKWYFYESHILEADKTRDGETLNIPFRPFKRGVKELYFQAEVWDLVTDERQTYETEKPLPILYPLDNGGIMWYEMGEKVKIPDEDCKSIQISSEKYAETEIVSDSQLLTMPGCKVNVSYIPATYTVKFYNADYTLLETKEVKCGEAAPLPANPTYGGLTFKKWSKEEELKNVQSNLSVVAQYEVSDDYYMLISMNDHRNNVYKFDHFAESETRVMVGDSLIFEIAVGANVNAALYYETAQWNNTQQKWIWGDGKKIGDYTTGSQQFYKQAVGVYYNPLAAEGSRISWNESRLGVRFYLLITTNKLYSDPYEYDVYYPLNILSPSGRGVLVENGAGDFGAGSNFVIPSHLNDTIRVYDWNGGEGGCMALKRTKNPAYYFESGVDANGTAYFLGLNENETISADVQFYTVTFTVPGAPNIGYGNGVVRKEENVPCGGAVTVVPEDPKENGYCFNGWKSDDTDKYADNAYLCIPSTADNSFPVNFTADMQKIDDQLTFYEVKFFRKDGTTQIGATQKIAKGENATPPTAPEETGFHFAGWDKPYTNITENTNITALYGDDSKNWTVTYYDEDGTTKMGEETVADKMPANGLKVYKEGATFVHWLDMATDSEANLLSIGANLNVKAVFDKITQLNHVQSAEYGVQKIMLNGQLYLMYEGTIYTVQGQKVR